MERFNCFCIDQSENCLNAFMWYLENFHRESDTVGILHVTNTPKISEMMTVERHHHYMNINKASVNNLIKKYTLILDERKFKYKLLLAEDHRTPGTVICEVAKENKANTITVAQRGLSSFSRTLLGSTSDFVIHNTDIPVIVVPILIPMPEGRVDEGAAQVRCVNPV